MMIISASGDQILLYNVDLWLTSVLTSRSPKLRSYIMGDGFNQVSKTLIKLLEIYPKRFSGWTNILWRPLVDTSDTYWYEPGRNSLFYQTGKPQNKKIPYTNISLYDLSSGCTWRCLCSLTKCTNWTLQKHWKLHACLYKVYSLWFSLLDQRNYEWTMAWWIPKSRGLKNPHMFPKLAISRFFLRGRGGVLPNFQHTL